jgi:peroxiredoxin
VELHAHDGPEQNLRALLAAYPFAALYFYPADKNSPLRDDMAHNNGFRDRHKDFAARDCRVIGISTEPPSEQADRIKFQKLEHVLLSDPDRILAKELGLETYQDGGERFYRRSALIVEAGLIVQVFFPVIDAARNAAQVLDWLRAQRP